MHKKLGVNIEEFESNMAVFQAFWQKHAWNALNFLLQTSAAGHFDQLAGSESIHSVLHKRHDPHPSSVCQNIHGSLAPKHSLPEWMPLFANSDNLLLSSGFQILPHPCPNCRTSLLVITRPCPTAVNWSCPDEIEFRKNFDLLCSLELKLWIILLANHTIVSLFDDEKDTEKSLILQTIKATRK